jgi:protein-S-isoprenylcysteine O-methyltransferase Ste14
LIPLVALLGYLYVVAAFGHRWSIGSWAVGGTSLLLGEALRLSIAGHARPGTSGRGTTIRAATLVTDGMYVATRNPLYLANWLQWLGAATITGAWWAPPLVATVVALQYHFIIRAEEAFLAHQFGLAFDRFVGKTPRFLPRPGFGPFPGRFDFRKALFREHDTIFLVFLGLFIPPAARAFLQEGPPWPWAALGTLALGAWIVTKTAKKRSKQLPENCRSLS